MLHITDAMIDAAVTPSEAQRILLDAWLSWGHGRAAMQERVRSEADGVKISTMGAVIPAHRVAGAKVYTTIKGQFSFVILLFSTDDGRPLASLDAGAITRLRTAAGSVLAARHLAKEDSRVLALLGAGTQGQAHAAQLSAAYGLERIKVFDPYASSSTLAAIEEQCGVPVEECSSGDATIDEADIVVTASRSAVPLFSGDKLPSRCFVAAIGSSSSTSRELDDSALRRADVIAIEWRQQSLREAGDIVLAAPDALQPPERIVEISDLVTGRATGRVNGTGICIYKSVGVGLQDIALAGLAWRNISSHTE